MRRGSAFVPVRLHFLYDGAEPAAHGITRLICDFQHTGVAVLHGLDAGCHIGDTAYGKYLHAHIVADHRLRYGAHAYSICAHAREGADLGGGLVAGVEKLKKKRFSDFVS